MERQTLHTGQKGPSSSRLRHVRPSPKRSNSKTVSLRLKIRHSIPPLRRKGNPWCTRVDGPYRCSENEEDEPEAYC